MKLNNSQSTFVSKKLATFTSWSRKLQINKWEIYKLWFDGKNFDLLIWWIIYKLSAEYKKDLKDIFWNFETSWPWDLPSWANIYN